MGMSWPRRRSVIGFVHGRHGRRKAAINPGNAPDQGRLALGWFEGLRLPAGCLGCRAGRPVLQAGHKAA
eukprot:12067887-Alexandrium_andersonii.AAC.1